MFVVILQPDAIKGKVTEWLQIVCPKLAAIQELKKRSLQNEIVVEINYGGQLLLGPELSK
jgi:hypothetical protein